MKFIIKNCRTLRDLRTTMLESFLHLHKCFSVLVANCRLHGKICSHHEAHEEHEEFGRFILLPSCSSRPSWWKLSFLLCLRLRRASIFVVRVSFVKCCIRFIRRLPTVRHVCRVPATPFHPLESQIVRCASADVGWR